jgi:hypothetical protein
MIEVPMTDAQFASAQNQLRERGIQLSGPSGTLRKDGITARYEYAAGKLCIEILDRPLLLPLGLIEGQLKSYFEQTLSR